MIDFLLDCTKDKTLMFILGILAVIVVWSAIQAFIDSVLPGND